MKLSAVSKEPKVLRVKTDAGDVQMCIQEDPPESQNQCSGLILILPKMMKLIPIEGGRYLVTPIDEEDMLRAAGIVEDQIDRSTGRIERDWLEEQADEYFNQ